MAGFDVVITDIATLPNRRALFPWPVTSTQPTTTGHGRSLLQPSYVFSIVIVIAHRDDMRVLRWAAEPPASLYRE